MKEKMMDWLMKELGLSEFVEEDGWEVRDDELVGDDEVCVKVYDGFDENGGMVVSLFEFESGKLKLVIGGE